MTLEQTVKDLQTQHTHFQETLLNLAKGQQEMMEHLVTKKNTKKRVFINIGRRFKGPTRLAQAEDVSSEEDDNQDEDVRSTRAGVEITKFLRMRIISMSNTHWPMTSIRSWKTD